MKVRSLSIDGAWAFEAQTFEDLRGSFVNPFISEVFERATGRRLEVAQTNHTVSRTGVVRGAHFAQTPPGQAKYVYCPRGSVIDVVVDLRVGSPTFAKHETVALDDSGCNAVTGSMTDSPFGCDVIETPRPRSRRCALIDASAPSVGGILKSGDGRGRQRRIGS